MGPVLGPIERKQEGSEHSCGSYGNVVFMLISSLHNLNSCCQFANGKTEAHGDHLCLATEVVIDFCDILPDFSTFYLTP